VPISVENSDPAKPPGLRERSKARRRALIIRTAMRLFADQGYAQTTVAEIAAAAELAPRTVAVYFPNKLDIATAYAEDLSARLTAAFHARPDDDLLDVLDAWLTAEADLFEPETARLALAMYRENPGLAALGRGRLTEATGVFSHAIASHLGVQDDDPIATITLATLAAALGVYINVITDRMPTRELHDWIMIFLRDMLGTALASGPPPPPVER
jgi:AcrR family transcriptional regulator